MAIYYRTAREICEAAEEQDARERDVTRCAHCEVDIHEPECIETAHGFLVCSTRCGVALETFGHREACRAIECADGAVLTLPSQLCGLCDGPTPDGDTAHSGCREKIRNAFALQDGARLGATS